MHNKTRITNYIKGKIMNKVEFIAAVSTKANITKKDATVAVNAVLETITETLVKGESIQFVGFGSFNVKDRAARTATIPGTTKTIQVPASKAISFKAGKDLRSKVNSK